MQFRLTKSEFSVIEKFPISTLNVHRLGFNEQFNRFIWIQFQNLSTS